jgi:hypothetical protein
LDVKLGVFGPAFVRGKKYDTDEAFEYVSSVLNELDAVDNVITGGGIGVESLALKWATLRHIDSDVIPPNIKLHGLENAFIYRNKEILKAIDFGILFWDGKDTKAHRLLSDAVETGTRLLVIHVE